MKHMSYKGTISGVCSPKNHNACYVYPMCSHLLIHTCMNYMVKPFYVILFYFYTGAGIKYTWLTFYDIVSFMNEIFTIIQSSSFINIFFCNIKKFYSSNWEMSKTLLLYSCYVFEIDQFPPGLCCDHFLLIQKKTCTCSLPLISYFYVHSYFIWISEINIGTLIWNKFEKKI